MRFQRTRFTKGKVVVPTLMAVILALAILPLRTKSVWGQASIVTETNIRNAILNPSQYTQDQLNLMDQNGDGKLDVADVVHLLNSIENAPKASFSTEAMNVSQSQGNVTVPITLTKTYTGTLHYQVDGSAIAGTDYDALSGTLTVQNATAASIPLALHRDAAVQGTKTLILTLLDQSAIGGNATSSPSTIVISVTDGQFGSYSGSVTFAEGLHLPSESANVVFDQPTPGQYVARFDSPQSGLFPSGISVPLSGTPGSGFTLGTTPITGQSAASVLKRNINWKLTFGSTAFDGTLLTAPFTITFDTVYRDGAFDSGVTASTTPVTVSGSLLLNPITAD